MTANGTGGGSDAAKAGRAIGGVVVAVVSLAVAVLAFLTAKWHLNTLGFAAAPKERNEFLFTVQLAVGILALVNAALALTPHGLKYATALLVPIVVGTALLMFAGF
jgi:hypothetical protein